MAQMLPMPDIFISQELLRNSEKLRLILDAADMPINYCSANRVFLFVNKTYAAWYGKTPEEIIGKSLSEILGPEGDETIRPYYERALSGEHVSYETEVNLSIGFKYLQCKYTPIENSAGEVTGWVGIIYDMTQRYLLQKALEANEAALIEARDRAEAANVAKSDFLANMSHEIRTPMNAIVGLSHVLSVSAPLSEKQKQFIQTLQLSAKSLLGLINDLLDYSKIECNSVHLEALPFRLSELLDETVDMFRVEAERKNLFIHCEKAPFDTLLLGDSLRIKQILVNLLGNALKFTGWGGISLRVDAAVRPQSRIADIRIGVKDTGIGISADKVNAIFEKFIQADMSITRKFGGSGLGLSISQKLASLMGGAITVESAIGKGSEFVLHLPLPLAESKMASPSHPRPSPKAARINPRNLTVLLAEDHAPNVLVATTLLDTLGHRYELAKTGKEVVSLIRKNYDRYDLVLMDVEMPEMDGYTATRFIRDYERTKKRRLPIIGVTAHVMPKNIKSCFEAGMDDCLPKPFHFEALREKIFSFFDK